MLTSKLQTLLLRLSRPQNLLRLGLLAFLITTLLLRLPLEFRLALNPDVAQAAGACGNKCESAGHCWDEGTKAGNGDTGKQYVCRGGDWQYEREGTSQEAATAKALKNQYDEQVRAAGGAGSAAGIGSTAGVYGSGNCSGSSPTARVCQGQPIGSLQSGYWCVPTNSGYCSAIAQGSADAARLGSDANGDGRLDGVIQQGNQASGGCPFVVTCSCASGTKQTCMFGDILSPSQVGNYCTSKVCTAIGTGGKVCEPGQIKCTVGVKGQVCNAAGTGYYPGEVAAHACGATTGSAYCTNTNSCTGSGCSTPVSRTSTSGQTVNCFNSQQQCATSVCGTAAGGNYSSCASCQNTSIKLPAASAVTCTPGVSSRSFIGCDGNKNCYAGCNSSGVKYDRQCTYEPGLSCGAKENLTPVQQAVAAVVQTRTIIEPTPPPPTPTPTPKATCGESCGSGVVCTGSNMACVSGTCRSTLCAPADQDNQCVCKPPPPVAPICIDIWASKTAPVLNDQVTFTCAQVNDTERYEFRVAFTQNKTSLAGAQVVNLAPASTTSNVSQPITIDKVGRYIAQCRPCAANNLCQEWEPLDGQIGAPELAPADAAIIAAQSAAGTNTSTETTTETATGSGQTATESGTQQ